MKNKQFSAETINEFGICYIPNQSVSRTDLLWNRLALPIQNYKGKVIAYAGRRLTTDIEDLRDAYLKKYRNDDMVNSKINKWNNSKWINEPYEKIKNLYNYHRAAQHIYEKNYCIVVEGYFDVIAFHQKGIKNVVATCGTTLSKHQIMMIKSLCDFVYVLYDPDIAGKNAAVKAQELCNNYCLNNKIITLPDGNDPDEFIINKNCNKLESVLVEYISKENNIILLR